MAVHLDTTFINCTEALLCASRMAVAKVCLENLRDEEYTMHGLNYFALRISIDRYYLLASFEYCLKETVFDRRLQLRSTDLVVANSHSVEFFSIHLTGEVSYLLRDTSCESATNVLFSYTRRLLSSFPTIQILS